MHHRRRRQGSGQGPGLSNYTLGETAGTESVTLNAQQMPGHNHGVNASSGDATDSQPGGHFPAAVGTGAYGKTSDGLMNQAMTAPVGGSQPDENRQPYLTLNWCIALEGIFPSRN